MADLENVEHRTEEGLQTASPSSPATISMISTSNSIQEIGMTQSQAVNLYTSHLLSTWNVRSYEFAVIIFTADAYPDTLVASSIRGIVRTVASICFASVVGRWVDRSPNRMKTLSSTISLNRIAVITASVLWFIISGPEKNGGTVSGLGFRLELSPTLKNGIFTLILFLGIVETLSASGNMLSMERDFVPTAADPSGEPYDLTHLNSVMRRIDLTCKLVAPIMISIVISTTSVRIGILVVAAMSALSWGIELWCAKRVWDRNAKLRIPKAPHHRFDSGYGGEQAVRQYLHSFRKYFFSPVWVPSFALALLHLSALSYGATFITFLLSSGFSLGLITIARACGSVVEISSTLVTPVGVRYLGKAKNHGVIQGRERINAESEGPLLESAPELSEADAITETGLQRLGLWGLCWQLGCLVPVLYALWTLTQDQSPSTFISRIIMPKPSFAVQAFTIFAFLSFSRLGLWIFDLTTQQLTQTLNPPQLLSSFTGVEYSFVSIFELCQHVMGIFWGRPEDFKWIASVSLMAVLTSSVAYAGWVRHRRGHLVHWENVTKCCERMSRG